jgi:hypothetical protein
MAPTRLNRVAWAVALVAVFVVAVWARWRLLPVASALGDAVGPWWVAARGDSFATPHAPPYGLLLAVPYRLIMVFADSLWQATSALLVLHAAIAPLATWAARRMGGGLPAAVLVGLAAALDPGLLDTAASGAEGYLAPVWVCAALVAFLGERPRPLLGGLALVAAVHNHPLALAALPLIAVLPTPRIAAWAGLGLLPLIPHLVGLFGQPVGVGDGTPHVPTEAVVGWVVGEGRAAILVGLALVWGLVQRPTRRLSGAVLAGGLLLVMVGGAVGYLRDHHLRLLLVPALVGLAAPWPWRRAPLAVLGLAVFLVVPTDPVQRAHQARRPGTHGLLEAVTRSVQAVPERPLVVDGAWISSSPAVEPGAVLLDLHLRGASAEDLSTGGAVAVVVSAERPDLAALPPGLSEVHRGDRHVVLLGEESEVTRWLGELCQGLASDGAPPPRAGGAFDGLIPLHPNLEAARVQAWWTGCEI